LDLGLIDAATNNRGVLSNNYLTRLAEVTDGTSNTILVTECAGRPELWRTAGLVSGYASGGVWVAGTLILFSGSTPDGATKLGPCPINCSNNREPFSFHPIGMNAVFADGSARFLREDTDIRFFARLVTKAGGEVVATP
jgi:hypothetical protein